MACRREELLHELEIIRVIDDQQPLVMGGEPVFDCGHNFILVLLLSLRKVEQRCQVYVTGDERVTGCRVSQAPAATP